MSQYSVCRNNVLCFFKIKSFLLVMVVNHESRILRVHFDIAYTLIDDLRDIGTSPKTACVYRYIPFASPPLPPSRHRRNACRDCKAAAAAAALSKHLSTSLAYWLKLYLYVQRHRFHVTPSFLSVKDVTTSVSQAL